MKVLTVVGEDQDGNLEEFHIINPMNVVVNRGVIQKEGTLEDPSNPGQKLPVHEERTFIRVGGQPIFAKEGVDAVIEKAKAL